MPLLGRIPLLGILFSYKSTLEQRTELLVFITPRVISSVEEGNKVTEQEQKLLPSNLKKEKIKD